MFCNKCYLKYTVCINIFFLFSLKQYNIYMYIVFPIFICLPVVGVVVLSLLITLIVTSYIKTSERRFSAPDTRTPSKVNSIKKQHKKQKQAILQLLLIACCFIIGYIPIFGYFKLNILQLWQLFSLKSFSFQVETKLFSFFT